MNRIVIIGNGFDLAHGLKTSYKDFIDWYWDYILFEITRCQEKTLVNPLLKFTINFEGNTWYTFCWQRGIDLNTTNSLEFIKDLEMQPDYFTIEYSAFFKQITQAIENKGWVDIENEFYQMLLTVGENSNYKNPDRLNKELNYLKEKLIEYLTIVQKKKINADLINETIHDKIFAPIHRKDVAIASGNSWISYEMGFGANITKIREAIVGYFHEEKTDRETKLLNRVSSLTFPN